VAEEVYQIRWGYLTGKKIFLWSKIEILWSTLKSGWAAAP